VLMLPIRRLHTDAFIKEHLTRPFCFVLLLCSSDISAHRLPSPLKRVFVKRRPLESFFRRSRGGTASVVLRILLSLLLSVQGVTAGSHVVVGPIHGSANSEALIHRLYRYINIYIYLSPNPPAVLRLHKKLQSGESFKKKIQDVALKWKSLLPLWRSCNGCDPVVEYLM